MSRNKNVHAQRVAENMMLHMWDLGKAELSPVQHATILACVSSVQQNIEKVRPGTWDCSKSMGICVCVCARARVCVYER